MQASLRARLAARLAVSWDGSAMTRWSRRSAAMASSSRSPTASAARSSARSKAASPRWSTYAPTLKHKRPPTWASRDTENRTKLLTPSPWEDEGGSLIEEAPNFWSAALPRSAHCGTAAVSKLILAGAAADHAPRAGQMRHVDHVAAKFSCHYLWAIWRGGSIY